VKLSFSQLNARERMMALVTVIVVLGVLFVAICAPRYKELKMLQQKETELRNTIRQLQTQMGMTPLLPSAGNETESVGKSEASLPTLLEEMTLLIQKHRVELLSLKPVLSGDKGSYQEYHVGIDLQGKYRNFVEFMDHVERMPRWTHVQDIHIKEDETDRTKVDIHMEVVVFHEKERT
jgi:Tfp pilus assembly protein PilO